MKAAILDFAIRPNNPNFAELAESAGPLGRRAGSPPDVKPKTEQPLIDAVVGRSWRCRRRSAWCGRSGWALYDQGGDRRTG